MPSELTPGGTSEGLAQGEATPPGPYDDEISLLEVFNVVLRQRYTILGVSLTFGVLALAVAMLLPPRFAASASFVPQASAGPSGQLSSLASRFGLNVGSPEQAGESPAFYAKLLRSRELLRPVAEDRYVPSPGRAGAEAGDAAPSATLPELLDIEEDAPGLVTVKTIEWLDEEAIRVETDLETGLVTLAVVTPWAQVSLDITRRLVELTNQFNLETRQSRAAAERTFVEGRLAEAEDSLRVAEARLEAFLESNRQFQNSPELAFRHDRLRRQVVRAQEIVTSLSQAYESARVNEVRNTPVITLVEHPELPVQPESRRLVLMMALGLVLGGFLGVLVAFGREMILRESEQQTDLYQEFSNLWQRTWWDMRTLGGRLA